VKAGVSKAWVCRIVKKVLRAEKAKGHVEVLVTGDRQIRSLNKKFLRHDNATDVISFQMDEPGYLGDVVVSADTARRLSRELGISYKEELARYVVHGTLHLLGYEDKKKNDHKKMHGRQEIILKSIR